MTAFSNIKIGVLSLQGDVSEHIKATKSASENLNLKCQVVEVRTKSDLNGLVGLIIPGGESTTLQKLCERESLLEGLGQIKCIFGTCAGAIMLAKVVQNKEEGQKTLGLMDISIDRNAYGRQSSSFETDINAKIGNAATSIHAIFIRAPRITSTGKSVVILAENSGEIIACEQETKSGYYLASCFHPEFTTNLFHTYFIKKCLNKSKSA